MFRTTVTAATILLAALTTKAQVDLEHSYDQTATLWQVAEGEHVYARLDGTMLRVTDVDHSPLFTLQTAPETGYIPQSVALLSRTFFNTDPDDIEVLVVYFNSTSLTYYAEAWNENGVTQATLDNVYYAIGRNTEAGGKMVCGNYATQGVDVYSVPGELPQPDQEPEGVATLEADQIRLYPNPAVEAVRLEIEPGTQVELYDQAGHLLISDRSQYASYSVDVSRLPAGVYTVAAGELTTKLVVVR